LVWHPGLGLWNQTFVRTINHIISRLYTQIADQIYA